MPFQDLPARGEESAPIFDGSDPCKIGRYFDNLEFLFLRHHVSDDQEKKRTTVRYTSWALEKLWQSMPTFSEHVCSYEDFKAEVIVLYPEADTEHKYTLTGLAQLVSNHMHTPVHSERELGEFYRVFLLVSCFLIAKGHLSTQEQGRAFLASFEPRLGTATVADSSAPFWTTSQRTPTVLMIFTTPLYMSWHGSVPRLSYNLRAQFRHLRHHSILCPRLFHPHRPRSTRFRSLQKRPHIHSQTRCPWHIHPLGSHPHCL
jgi:hypothetical protein